MKYTKELLTHLFIELYHNYNCGMLHEQFVRKKRLYEEFGLSEEVEKLAHWLSSQILDDKVSKQYIVNNDWLGYIDIVITNKEYNLAWYTTYGLKEEIVNNHINAQLWISENLVTDNSDNNHNLYILLVHELTHIYEDYNRRIKDVENGLYKDSVKYIKNRPENFEGYLKIIGFIIYFYREHEMRAYISQMIAEINLNDKTYSSIEDIIDDIKETRSYKQYVNAENWVEYFLNNNFGERQIKDLLKNVNYITNTDFKNWKQFLGYLDNRRKYFNKKLMTLLPKVALKRLNLTRGMSLYNSLDFDFPSVPSNL